MSAKQYLPGPARQRGLSAIGIVLGLAVIASILTVALKLGPHLIDYRTILGVVNSLPADQVHRMSRAELTEVIEKRMRVNNLYELRARDIIDIERARELTTLTVGYERRENLFLNVDVVITFRKAFDYH
jgi:hypothetical protein